MTAFGRKLAEHRTRFGMTQKVLAERVGLTASHLNRVEKGTRPPPQIPTVLRMIEALRLDEQEAKELVQLAGYSPKLLDPLSGLVSSSSTVDHEVTESPLAELEAFLDTLDHRRRQAFLDALLALIRVLAVQPAQEEGEDAGEEANGVS
jgi:transcriptional regulator with XRE-family HTH domain